MCHDISNNETQYVVIQRRKKLVGIQMENSFHLTDSWIQQMSYLLPWLFLIVYDKMDVITYESV